MSTPAIDVNRALMLRGLHLTWREIGVLMGNEDWREFPYKAHSVASAVKRELMRRLEPR